MLGKKHNSTLDSYFGISPAKKANHQKKKNLQQRMLDTNVAAKMCGIVADRGSSSIVKNKQCHAHCAKSTKFVARMVC